MVVLCFCLSVAALAATYTVHTWSTYMYVYKVRQLRELFVGYCIVGNFDKHLEMALHKYFANFKFGHLNAYHHRCIMVEFGDLHVHVSYFF